MPRLKAFLVGHDEGGLQPHEPCDSRLSRGVPGGLSVGGKIHREGGEGDVLHCQAVCRSDDRGYWVFGQRESHAGLSRGGHRHVIGQFY